MKHLFNPESGVWQIFGFIGDVIMLSLLWVVCSAPMLTLGAASAALYDSVTACFRRKEQDYLRRFFRTLKRDLKASLLPTLLWTAILFLAWWIVRVITGTLTGTAGIVITAVLLALIMIPLGCACWIFPLLSRFTLDFRTLNGNAVRLALGHIPSTYALALGLALAGWLTLRFALLPFFFLPALLALYFSLFLEPFFQQYEGQEET